MFLSKVKIVCSCPSLLEMEEDLDLYNGNLCPKEVRKVK